MQIINFYDPTIFPNPIYGTIPKELVKKTRKKKKVKISKVKCEPINLDKVPLDPEVLHIIQSGEVDEYKSRSEVLFFVIDKLIDIGLRNSQILSILFDRNYGISERPVEKGKTPVLNDIRRIRKKHKRRKPYKNIEPFYSENKINRKENGQKKLQHYIAKFFSDLDSNIGIKAPAGLGKTREAIKAISEIVYKGIIEIYVPTNKLADELDNIFFKKYPNISVKAIKGRGNTNKNGIALCKKANVINNFSNSSEGAIYKRFCKNADNECKHFNECPYLGQNKNATQVKIFSHAYLPLGRGFLDKEVPIAAIIDESYYSGLIAIEKLALKDLLDQIQIRSSRNPDLTKEIKDANKLYRAIVRACEHGWPLLEQLRDTFKNPKRVIKAALEQIAHTDPVILPSMTEAQIDSKIKKLSPQKRKLKKLLSSLYDEITKFPKRDKSFSVRYVRNMQGKNSLLEIAIRHNISRFTLENTGKTVPTLFIDADFTPKINKAFISTDYNYRITVKRNATVTQVISTRNSNYSFFTKGDNNNTDNQINRIRQLQKIIKRLSKRGKTLIVGPSGIVGNENTNIEPLIKINKNSDFEHFGNIRGIDQYKDYDTVIIIGRNQPPSSAMEAEAAALWWDSEHPPELDQDLIDQPRGYRHKDKLGVNVQIHPDKKVQLLLEMKREHETLQAIDRLRLIHNEKPKNVYILSNLVLDIDVDHFLTWKELHTGGTVIERSFSFHKKGVMPLSADYLYDTRPKLFPSVDMAKQTIKRFKDSINVNSQSDIAQKKGENAHGLLSDTFYLIVINTTCHLINYRVKHAQGRDKTALIRSGMNIDSIKECLKQIHDEFIIDKDRYGDEVAEKEIVLKNFK